MNKFTSLLKVQLKSQLGLSLARYAMKNDKKALWKGIGLGLVILFAIGQFAFIYTFLIIKVHEAAAMLNAQSLILTFGAVLSGLFILFFGIFYILGALFLAKDTELLSSLPIKQEAVFLSKFCTVLLGEYPFVLFLMIPPVVIYGMGSGKGALYYVMALVCMILLPLVPLVISSLLSLGLMRLVSQSRRRDLITIVGSSVLLVGLFVGQYALFARIPENDPDFLIQLLENSDHLVSFAGRLFPPSIWITRALTLPGSEAAINFLLLLGISLLALLIVYFSSSFIYQRGATAQLEAVKQTTGTRLTYKKSSPVTIFFKNEWRILLRTPVYAMNSLIMILIGPILMSMSLFGGNLANEPEIEAIYAIINNHEISAYFPFAIAGILAILAMINPAVSSTFSREGKCIWILKHIPVKPIHQVFGKLLAGYSISLMATVTTAIVMVFAFKIKVGMILTALFISSLILVPICTLGILIDLLRPKLKWGNPQEAIKQNMNVMLGMVAGFLIFIVAAGIGFLILQSTLPFAVSSAVLFLFMLALAIGSVLALRKVSDNIFHRIEG